MDNKGRIYLLMGYLGTGKTTFIRNLLANKQGVKYAVIQNQFAAGQMGIEQPLIMDESGVPFSNFLELPNGCICCSAKNDLVASVQYILSNTDVRNVIVQTNGLADPAQSIKQFWFDQQMKINAQLHSIISIISVNRYHTLKNEQLFNKQIAYANKILLTFIDKSSVEQVSQVQNKIHNINQQCIVQKNDSYNIIQFLSGGNMFDLESLNLPESKTDHNHEQSQHQGIDSIFIKGYIQCKQIQQFQIKIGQLLWQTQYSTKIMRIKGAISLNSENKQQNKIYQLQGVDDIFEIKPTETSTQKFQNETRILIIGKQLQKQDIAQILGIN